MEDGARSHEHRCSTLPEVAVPWSGHLTSLEVTFLTCKIEYVGSGDRIASIQLLLSLVLQMLACVSGGNSVWGSITSKEKSSSTHPMRCHGLCRKLPIVALPAPFSFLLNVIPVWPLSTIPPNIAAPVSISSLTLPDSSLWHFPMALCLSH